ncbi:hypothetical protein BDK51DRAFT_52210 [Blyttiomyces helicus]|uniref:Uncharacterized protein n=1 Tax=Blyttiomyces helicus TaxID=388810 RepID=A0A4P9VWA9_9FUNG|nr:hypothetical protein BDK51DRAFT_52210 [Blyttiomyces helicus]|eukprot:RKO83135.1 hypothetical protein BDK51DRAFT_52210 [Blyttiomyces helicus]
MAEVIGGGRRPSDYQRIESLQTAFTPLCKGYPVLRNKVKCTTCNRAANKDDWNKFVLIERDGKQDVDRTTETPILVSYPAPAFAICKAAKCGEDELTSVLVGEERIGLEDATAASCSDIPIAVASSLGPGPCFQSQFDLNMFSIQSELVMEILGSFPLPPLKKNFGWLLKRSIIVECA